MVAYNKATTTTSKLLTLKENSGVAFIALYHSRLVANSLDAVLVAIFCQYVSSLGITENVPFLRSTMIAVS